MDGACNVIEFGAPRRQHEQANIENLWQLRWRIMGRDGVAVQSAWTPEMRYPSITDTLGDFDGRIAWLAIDARSVATGEAWGNLLRVPGHLIGKLSFKMFGMFGSARDIVGGIEIETPAGDTYLVLRNGTIHVEEAG